MHPPKRLLAMTCTVAGLALPATASAAPDQAAGGINQGNLISALNNVAVQVDRVNALNDLTVQDVQVVNVQDVVRNSRVLDNALRDADIDVLTNFLNGSLNNNEVVKDVLDDANVAITDVVAINVLSGGDVVVFER